MKFGKEKDYTEKMPFAEPKQAENMPLVLVRTPMDIAAEIYVAMIAQVKYDGLHREDRARMACEEAWVLVDKMAEITRKRETKQEENES